MAPRTMGALSSRAVLALLVLLWAGAAAAAPFSISHSSPIGVPLGVTASGLQAVYSLKTTSGPRTGGYTTAPLYSNPSGVTYSAGSHATTIASTGAVSLIDMAGNGLFVTNNGTTGTITDAKLSSLTTTTYLLATGVTAGGAAAGNPSLDLEHFSADYTGAGQGHSGPIELGGTGSLTLKFGVLQNAVRDYIVIDSGSTVLLDSLYFGAFGQAADPGDHLEYLHFFGGSGTVSHSFFNATDGLFPTGGISGFFQIQTGLGTDPSTYTAGPITLTFDGDIILGGAYLNQFIWSCKAVFDDIDVTVKNGAINKGTPGYWIQTPQADITVTGVTGTFVSGEVLSGAGKTGNLLGALSGGSNLHLSGWSAQWTAGTTITGGTSGATATISAVRYHTCTIHDGGGNHDYTSGLPVTVS